jgi:hypothetical protein
MYSATNRNEQNAHLAQTAEVSEIKLASKHAQDQCFSNYVPWHTEVLRAVRAVARRVARTLIIHNTIH